nr:hypothetical protein [Tanacetum cinerariifolium]
MVRGKGYRKRPYEKIEQWMNNEISFPFVPRNLRPDTKAKLTESRILLVGFSGKVYYALGVIDVSVSIGKQDRIRTVVMDFAVVNVIPLTT